MKNIPTKKTCPIFYRPRSPAMNLTIALLLSLSIHASAEEPSAPTDITDLSIEQLLDVEVYSASKFTQKTSEAPAAVTIITAADIKTYGYRTLADILSGVRGMFVTDDRNYQYLGVRGFNRPGDYNGRILLLLDGYRLNDPIYDTAAIGTDFPLDIDLIDRVEVVRGPGSSIYGGNAFFGVINVITKRGSDLNGPEVSGELASFNTNKERLSYGKRYENGAELLLSASNYRSAGQDLFFPEFNAPASNNGIAHALDGDRYKRYFGKLAYEEFTLTTGYSNRIKNVPTAPYATVFNDPNMRVTDGATFMDIGYYGEPIRSWDVSGHVFQGSYSYQGIYPYAGAPITLNKDTAQGDWRGAELKLLRRFEKHKVVTGFEYRDNYRQDQSNFDIAPYTLYLDDKRSNKREGGYLQDEITLSKELLLNAGLRYDHYSAAGGSTNPRLGLIWNPVAATALKFLYGTAFRAPNVYELYYAMAGSQKANPGLEPEQITSYEFVAEQEVQQNFRLTASIYQNNIRNLINQVLDPADGLLVFRNIGQVKSRGIEFEAERDWSNERQLRASYAYQITRDQFTNQELENSPRHLAKLNYSVPMLDEALRAGAELQFTGSRKTLSGGSTGGYATANLTLLSQKLAHGLELSGTVYNLFNRQYSDPARPEHMQDVIPQNGRSFRFKLSELF